MRALRFETLGTVTNWIAGSEARAPAVHSLNWVHLHRSLSSFLSKTKAAATAVIHDAYSDDLKLRSRRRDLITIGGRYLVIRDQIESELLHEYQWRLQVVASSRIPARSGLPLRNAGSLAALSFW